MTHPHARAERAHARPVLGTPALLSAVLDATDSLIIVTDIHSGTVVAFNTAAEKLFGLPRPEAVGRHLWDICPPPDHATTSGLYTTTHYESLLQAYEATTINESGGRHRVAWSSSFLTNPAGQRTHVVMTGVDVTSARATAGPAGQLMHAATTMVLIGTDLGGRVTFCSSAAEKAFGMAQQDIVGRWLPVDAFGGGELRTRVARVVRPEQAQVLGVEISALDRRGVRLLNLGPLDRRSSRRQTDPGASDEDFLRPRDWTVMHADGSQMIIEMTVSPVTDAFEEVTGYLLAGQDVTDQRRSKDLLVSFLAKEAEATARLRELDRVKDDLVATVSHELRTPLASILGYVELLTEEDGGTLTAQQRKWADAVGRNGDRLLVLVGDLLTVSAIDAGKLQSGSAPVDLRDVVSSARRALQPLVERRLVTSRFHLPELPVIVHGDAGQLERVVCNLMSNALKFTEDGGTVDCAVDVEDGRAKITVSDDGIGIPENEQLGLFTKFFRSTTATDRAIPGTGLGLSIVASIIKSHGGHVSVDSAPGRGTRVTVDLPVNGSGPLSEVGP